jgi:hypothetical protein
MIHDPINGVILVAEKPKWKQITFYNKK